MITLDTTSITYLFVLNCLVIAMFFTIEAILLGKKDKTTLMYIASKFLQAIGVILIIVRGSEYSPVLIILHNLLFYIGSSGELYSILRLSRINKRKSRNILLSAVLIATVLTTLNSVMHLPHGYRMFATTIFSCFIFLYFGIVILLNKDSNNMQRATGWFSIVFSIPWLLRGYYALNNFLVADTLTPHILQNIAYAGHLVFFSVLPLLYLFIFKEQAADKLRELNTTKDKFFRIIGHDLKSPVAQMIQFSQLIEDNYESLTDEKRKIFIKAIKDASVREFKLLENLLDWTRSQTGSISFKPEDFLIKDLINENIELLEKQAEGKNIQIVATNIHQGTITADRNMLSTVLRNLISNAIKFTNNNGHIEIYSTYKDDKLVVSVKDDGVGMTAEVCHKVFEIDSKHTTEGTNNEKGTGIGLILCKEFIDKHNGEIWINSKLGEGSTFSFSITVN